jgi:hypothetical protein
MHIIKGISIVALALTVAACDAPKQDKTVDNGIDQKDLSQLKAGVWIDPNGCDHWIIDDGAEGYLSARLDKYGKPVCSGAGAPGTAVGPFKSGSAIADPI